MNPTKFIPDPYDCSEEKTRALRAIVPEAFKDGKLDVEALRAALGESEEAPRERYGLSWYGKTEAIRAIHAPSRGTLRPMLGKSVNFEQTANVIIEGDNLEVLKLLQKAYLDAVKLILIDPPYNTGNDFIYPDDYSESLDTYLRYTGQIDAQGRRFGTNADTEGRFHSKWLSMMYPRLHVSRNLLRDDGFIMICIDDGEQHNLRCVMNEIFGEENFCGIFVWEKKRKPSFLDASMASQTEYIMVYAKDRSSSPALVSGSVEQGKMYPFNNAGNPLSVLTFPPKSVRFYVDRERFEPADMSEGNIRTKLLTVLDVVDGWNANAFSLEGEWRYSQKKVDEFIENGDEIVIRRTPFRPNYINRSERSKKMGNLLSVKGIGTPTYEDATAELRALFDTDVINYPKPVRLVELLIAAATGPSDLVLDFFAGSGTVAHAVLSLNRKEGSSRKFMLVQLPEPYEGAGYATIADICEERVRRVIAQYQRESQDAFKLERSEEDSGFRVFSLSESNIVEWDSGMRHDEERLQQELDMTVQHIRTGRTDMDLLYEVLLKSGYPLSAKVVAIDIAGKPAYSVSDGAFVISLERNLTLELIRAIAAKAPERVLLLDEGFAGNDQLKANAVQTFKTKNIVFRTL